MKNSLRFFSLFFVLIMILTIFCSIGIKDVYAADKKALWEHGSLGSLGAIRNALNDDTKPSLPPSSSIGTDKRFKDKITGWETIKTESSSYYTIIQEKMKNAYDNKGLKAAMASFNEHAQYVYGFLMAFGALTSLLMFIIIFVRITWLPEHAIQKRRAMEDMVVSGVATALLGGSWLIISLFYSIFARMWELGTVYSKNWKEVGGVFLTEYRGLIVGFLGIGTLTALLMMVKAIMGVIFAGTNPGQKSAKMMQVIWCGIATAGLGALTLFTSLFWNVFRF